MMFKSVSHIVVVETKEVLRQSQTQTEIKTQKVKNDKEDIKGTRTPIKDLWMTNIWTPEEKNKLCFHQTQKLLLHSFLQSKRESAGK